MNKDHVRKIIREEVKTEALNNSRVDNENHLRRIIREELKRYFNSKRDFPECDGSDTHNLYETDWHKVKDNYICEYCWRNKFLSDPKLKKHKKKFSRCFYEYDSEGSEDENESKECDFNYIKDNFDEVVLDIIDYGMGS